MTQLSVIELCMIQLFVFDTVACKSVVCKTIVCVTVVCGVFEKYEDMSITIQYGCITDEVFLFS